MYQTLLWIHSWWRWVVLLAGALSLAQATLGLIRRRPWTAQSRATTAAFVGVTDLQFLLGAVLYLFVSPLTMAAFADLGAAMHNAPLRFFAIEHGPTMLLALVLVHVGNLRARRAGSDALRHRRIVTWFGVAYALMLAAIPWPGLDVGRPLFR